MKYSKLIKDNASGLIFVTLIAICFYIYFIVYMTPSRKAWYKEMVHQMNVFYTEITHIGS